MTSPSDEKCKHPTPERSDPKVSLARNGLGRTPTSIQLEISFKHGKVGVTMADGDCSDLPESDKVKC